LDRLSNDVTTWKDCASQNDVKSQEFAKELTTWKDRALKAEGESHHLTNELKECEDRALKAEGENQRLAATLIEWKDHAVKSEGQSLGSRSHTPLETPSQVTVYLDNTSDLHIQYSYNEAGRLIQGFVPPAVKIQILCLLHQTYTFNVTDGTVQRYVRQVINRDNQKIVLWGPT